MGRNWQPVRSSIHSKAQTSHNQGIVTAANEGAMKLGNDTLPRMPQKDTFICTWSKKKNYFVQEN